MTGTPQADDHRIEPRWRLSLPVVVLIAALLFVAGLFAIFVAEEAAEAAAEEELLDDGVDRSRLPRAEAVALAKLARSRSGHLPHDMGHDHGHHPAGEHAHLTPQQGRVLDAQLRVAAEMVPRLDTPEEATSLGYVQASGETDGVGTHWVKWSLVDRPFDPAAPSMLLFDEVKAGNGPELIAYSYWVASDEHPEGFAGDADLWHTHLGMCFENGWLTTDEAPHELCDGDWINGSDLWMLHAWIVDDVENERGIFATVNPSLCERSCVPVEFVARPPLPQEMPARAAAASG